MGSAEGTDEGKEGAEEEEEMDGKEEISHLDECCTPGHTVFSCGDVGRILKMNGQV